MKNWYLAYFLKACGKKDPRFPSHHAFNISARQCDMSAQIRLADNAPASALPAAESALRTIAADEPISIEPLDARSMVVTLNEAVLLKMELEIGRHVASDDQIFSRFIDYVRKGHPEWKAVIPIPKPQSVIDAKLPKNFALGYIMSVYMPEEQLLTPIRQRLYREFMQHVRETVQCSKSDMKFLIQENGSGHKRVLLLVNDNGLRCMRDHLYPENAAAPLIEDPSRDYVMAK